MIDGGPTPSYLEALGIVGIVVVEAIVLYVGYGLVERLTAPRLIEYLTDA